MDQAPDQNTSQQEPAPTMEHTPAAKGPAYGSLLGIVVIVLVLIVGAFYVWGERLEMNQPTVPEEGVRGDTLPLDDSSAEGSVEVEVEGEPQPM